MNRVLSKSCCLVIAALLVSACGSDDGDAAEASNASPSLEATEVASDDRADNYFTAAGAVEVSVEPAQWGIRESNDALQLILFEKAGAAPAVTFEHISFDAGGKTFDLIERDDFAYEPVEAWFLEEMGPEGMYGKETSGTLEITELGDTMSGTFEFTAKNNGGEEVRVQGAFSGVRVPERPESAGAADSAAEPGLCDLLGDIDLVAAFEGEMTFGEISTRSAKACVVPITGAEGEGLTVQIPGGAEFFESRLAQVEYQGLPVTRLDLGQEAIRIGDSNVIVLVDDDTTLSIHMQAFYLEETPPPAEVLRRGVEATAAGLMERL